ncbi:MAG: hypothetical protein ABIW76_15310 [Fibrobacteria bacterium]
MNVLGNVKKFSLGGAFVGALVIAGSLSLTGCLTDDKKDDPAPATKEMVKTMNVNVGAQGNNTLGSFIDLDSYAVLKQAAAEAASGTVDLVFAYSGTANSSAVYSPDAAKAGIAGGAGLDIAQGLTTANKTALKTVDAAKFDALETVAGLDSLYNAGTAASPEGRLLISVGNTIAAKTTGGKVVAMKITAVTTAATGEATIQGKAKW